MRKILIVDDDALARMFLWRCFPWEERGYLIAGEASDGAEALALVESLSPDIVLTDIRMPVMDGIALLSRLRENGFDGGILVLSCHDEFAIVKEAMRLGADDYLRKSALDEQTLQKALELAMNACDRRRAAAQERALLRRMAEKGSRQSQRELMEALLTRDAGWEEQYRETQAAGLRYRYYRCAVLIADASQTGSSQARELFEVCRQTAAGRTAEVVELGRARCAMLYDFSDLPSTMQQNDILHTQSAELHQRMHEALRLGLSAVCEGGGAIARALRQATEALQMSFYGHEIWQFDEQRRMSRRPPPAAEAFAAALPAMLKAGDEARLEARFAAVLKAFAHDRVLPAVVLDWLKQCDTAAGVRTDELPPPEQLKHCGAHLDAYRARLRNLALPAGAAGVSPAVAKAVQYVRTHYTEPIGLGHAARSVGLSSPYLSRAFKREVGMGLNEFLLHCRLEHVAEQLTSGNRTIKQIAAEAGFQDYQHFCKMFKKKRGVTPAQYRKEYVQQ